MVTYKKRLSVALLMSLALCAEVATARYIPYDGPAVGQKATEPHSAQALEHAQVAAIHGNAGHADILTEHAVVALEHAKAAEQVLTEAAKEHMTVGIAHLHEAIEHGKLNHADIATEHVNEAITHIQASIGK